MMKVKKGICYWPTFEDARFNMHALQIYSLLPNTARIVGFTLGHAIQFQRSGDYVGPDLFRRLHQILDSESKSR